MVRTRIDAARPEHAVAPRVERVQSLAGAIGVQFCSSGTRGRHSRKSCALRGEEADQ